MRLHKPPERHQRGPINPPGDLVIIRIRNREAVPVHGNVVHAVGGHDAVAHQLNVVLAEAPGGVDEVADGGAGHIAGEGYVDVGAGAGATPAGGAQYGRGGAREEGAGGEEAGGSILRKNGWFGEGVGMGTYVPATILGALAQ